MAGDSLFGAEPARLKRLAALGFEDLPGAEGQSAAPTATHDLLAETLGEWIGPFKLLSVLGEGGMGVVYLVEQARPVKRTVALKLVKPGMDSKRVLARFEAEQQALALMEHPHIARVYDAGLAPSGRPYFVMEYIHGIPITAHCDEHRLTIEERLHLFLHVCEAVQHAHQKGIIHRDLKPSNILVTVQDKEVVPKVIDFGVARAMDAPLTGRTLFTEQGQLIGTPEYMSPEQADVGSQDIDTRTDIYSLGVVLYELLAGLLPFESEALRGGGIERIRKILCEEDPKTPSTRLSKTSAEESAESAKHRQTDVRTLQRKLTGDLDWITLKALEKDRSRRYATVDALATDIRNYLSHQPVSAAPPRTLYRAGKFARRHRSAVIATGAAVVLLPILLWMAQTYVQVAKEHANLDAFDHEQRLAQAQNALGSRNWQDALARAGPLMTSPHVGHRAKLLHAQALLGQEKPAAAIAELQELVTASDDTAGQAHFLLANLYHQGDPCSTGETEEYVRLWQQHSERAEKLIAGTAPYYLLQARAESDVKKKLQLLAQALAADKRHYESLRERAYLYLAQQDYELMWRDAFCMTCIQPENHQGYLLSAAALRELGRLDEALQDHDDAVRLAPQDPECYHVRWVTYMRLEQYERALPDIQKCGELCRGVSIEGVDYCAKRISTLIALGRYDEAEKEYDRFGHLLPDISREIGGHMMGSSGRILIAATILKDTFETLVSGRPCHPPDIPMRGAPCLETSLAEDYHQRLIRNARCIVAKGSSPSWSPDGTRLAYSLGISTTSAVAILDLATGRTELLVMPGSDPAWSPDGRRIAFVKTRQVLPIAALTGRNIQTFGLGQDSHSIEEVWVIDLTEPRTMRRIAEGGWPHWGRASGRLYYTSRRAKALFDDYRNTLYSISLDEANAAPRLVLSDCSERPVISPEEQRVADYRFRELRIIDVGTKQVVKTWLTPPRPRVGLCIDWSPDGREISLGGPPGSEMGLWIYDVQTGNAVRVVNSYVATARWSSGPRPKLAFGLGLPFMEIWMTDLTLGVPTAKSFDSVCGVKEHCLDMINSGARLLTIDPKWIDIRYLQADCALWMGHEKAEDYLQQLDQAMTPDMYGAASCIQFCRTVLDGHPELLARLRPLVVLLARKAVAKEPNNPDYAKVLDAVLKTTAGSPGL